MASWVILSMANHNSRPLIPGFLKLGTVYIWGQLIHYGGCPVCCRMFSSIPGLYSLVPVVTTENVSGYCQMSSGWGEEKRISKLPSPHPLPTVKNHSITKKHEASGCKLASPFPWLLLLLGLMLASTQVLLCVSGIQMPALSRGKTFVGYFLSPTKPLNAHCAGVGDLNLVLFPILQPQPPTSALPSKGPTLLGAPTRQLKPSSLSKASTQPTRNLLTFPNQRVPPTTKGGGMMGRQVK